MYREHPYSHSCGAHFLKNVLVCVLYSDFIIAHYYLHTHTHNNKTENILKKRFYIIKFEVP